jgi:hypothetical protein
MPSWQSLRLEATLFPRSDLLSLSDIHWNRVDELLGFGGARIEQNVLVTGGWLRGADGRDPRLDVGLREALQGLVPRRRYLE